MKNLTKFLSIVFLLVALLTGCNPATKQPTLILATTTSTKDSGLLDELIPLFEKKYNTSVKIIAVGTGEALAMGTRGEADALLVHDPKSEQELIKSGDVINRKSIMYNDFIVVGPNTDSAKIKGLTLKEAFTLIAEKNLPFVSRGDDSGTHKKELQLWKDCSITPTDNKNYLESGQGMGRTLQISAEKNAYTLTDRATYLAQSPNTPNFTVILEGDKNLRNIYHAMQVNPKKNKKINAKSAEQFITFLTSKEAQKLIKNFGVKQYGQPFFYEYLD